MIEALRSVVDVMMIVLVELEVFDGLKYERAMVWMRSDQVRQNG